MAIITQALKDYGRSLGEADTALVADATRTFTGREIAGIVPDALFDAFADGGRAITAEDLCRAAALVVPLSQTADRKIDELRKWANGRARRASKSEEETVATSSGRDLDLS
jgi:hypothetical protein